MFVEIGKNLCIISENINLDEILNNYVAFDCIFKLNSPSLMKKGYAIKVS